MAKVQFNYKNKKYLLEFLKDNKAILTDTIKHNCIFIEYSEEVKVIDFLDKIYSTDFSLNKHLIIK